MSVGRAGGLALHRILAISLVAAGLLSTIPLAASGCVPTCGVTTVAMAQFVPMLTVVESGSSVTWTGGTDNTAHTASDADLQGAFCFDAHFGRQAPSSALFFISDGTLYAATEDLVGGQQTLPCTAAQPLPDGSFVLDYICLFHLNMKAKLLVH